MNIFLTTFLNIKSNKQTFLMSIAMIAIAFSILGLFFLIFVNLNTLIHKWNKEVQLIVYLDDNISKNQLSKLEEIYKSNLNIDTFDYISKDYAWKNFKKTISEKSKFIETLDFNPLPASYIVKLKDGSERIKIIKELANSLKDQKGIESIEYGEKWISRFEKFMTFLRFSILAVGGAICLGLILIISNTIKISIYSRQDEIDLMLLLGATNRFIKTPLILEGMIQGLIGVFFSLGIVKCIHLYLMYNFQGSVQSIFRGTEFYYLTGSIFWSMIFSSILIGLFGSLISINQFLSGRFRR